LTNSFFDILKALCRRFAAPFRSPIHLLHRHDHPPRSPPNRPTHLLVRCAFLLSASIATHGALSTSLQGSLGLFDTVLDGF